MRREIETNRYPLVPRLDVDELAEIAIELRRPHISLRLDFAKGVNFPIGNLQPCRIDNSDFGFTGLSPQRAGLRERRLAVGNILGGPVLRVEAIEPLHAPLRHQRDPAFARSWIKAL
jgi:hypothetical protein